MKGRSTTEQGPPKEIKAADYIRKLRMLEKRIGTTTQYRILKPFPCRPRDAVNLQEAAKRIAAFVGLERFTFIVAVARQKKKVGGHIELKGGQQDVFIEISSQASRSSEATLAVLAHEISHKVLHEHGVSLGRGLLESYENEILTDITAVFMGLGKLVLNGAEARNETRNGAQRTIETIRTGYLSVPQLAFVYRLVCAMRGVRKKEMMSGVASQARSAIRACERLKSQFFDPRFRSEEYRRKLQLDLQSSANRLAEKLHQMRKQVSLARRNLINTSESFLAEAEQGLDALGKRMREISATEIYDPSYRFLDTLDLTAEIRTEHDRLTQVTDRVERWILDLDRASRCRDPQSERRS
ncbi:hypothetical protein ACFLTM_01560 [Candidatus Bipolaricaulota bacterium]